MLQSQKQKQHQEAGLWTEPVFKEGRRLKIVPLDKLLMLSHAFETIRCQRVKFRVDAFNFNSQRAVLRLGAKYEGELRNSCLLPEGRKRNYKIYSILDSEWSNIKATLNWYLDNYV